MTAAGRALGIRPTPSGNGQRRRHGRIAEPEQERSFALLRAVPGLSTADARDLARLAPPEEIAQAIGVLAGRNGEVRNAGGFLRRAILEGWETGDRLLRHQTVTGSPAAATDGGVETYGGEPGRTPAAEPVTYRFRGASPDKKAAS